MDTLASYDELPYDSLALPETQPDFLAAVARLHGFEAPDPRAARILEIGCAQGGNLIPLAWRWPDAECVGVELSRLQAESGNRFIAELGLTNVRILHADLAALPGELGAFDYIIAHGVYSWVPASVRTALLDLCRRHLAPSGLAYVSFNVESGWRPLMRLRETLLQRTAASPDAPARYRAARDVLDALARAPDDPLIAKEIAFLQQASPSYFFHEYLDSHNSPMRFDAFAQALDGHALRYVGEAGPRHAIVAIEESWGLAPEGLYGRWMDAEAALDDAHEIRFRRALIARDDAPCAQPAHPEAMESLAFFADLGSDDEIDLDQASTQFFLTPAGARVAVDEPLAKAAVMVLAETYPAALPYRALLQSARDTLAAFGAACGDGDIAAFRETLFQLVIAQAIMPTVLPAGGAAAPSATPRAHALAQLQAARDGWSVTGRRHVTLDLDAPARRLLSLLDGTRSRDVLARQMQAALEAAGEPHAIEAIERLIDQQLWTFARHGLLES